MFVRVKFLQCSFTDLERSPEVQRSVQRVPTCGHFLLTERGPERKSRKDLQNHGKKILQRT